MSDGKKIKPLVERKEQFARRQAERGLGLSSSQRPVGRGEPNRHGMPKLPVGQRQTRDWPVLDLGETPTIPLAEWRLTVDGECDEPRVLTWDDLLALPQSEDESDFHCVTTWSRMDNRWGGVRFADLAAAVRVRPAARFVLTEAYDQYPGTEIPYTTNLPLAEALLDDVMLVHTWEGKPLPVEHGGPLRMITPQLYAWKGAKWIKRVTFSATDRPGFWEVRGYSNTAYPWYDDRYSRR